MHMPLDGLRARDLLVDIQRQRLCITPKRGGNGVLLEGVLAQPILVDASTWMVEDGTLVLQLAKDNLRAANSGPSSEWWYGLFAGEDTIDTSAVSVGDYASTTQLRPDQRAEVAEAQAMQQDARSASERTAAEEAALPAEKQEALKKLRASFPDIPIEWGDTSR